MPKLSAYVAATSSAGPAGQQQQAAAVGRGGGAAAVAGDAPLAAGDQQHLGQAERLKLPAQGGATLAPAAAAIGSAASAPAHPHGTGGKPQLDAQQGAAAAKLAADYSKRLREHGPRTFRWPDGSLRPDRPPPNPHAVVGGAGGAVDRRCLHASPASLDPPLSVQAAVAWPCLPLNPHPCFLTRLPGKPAAMGAAGAALPHAWRRPCL